MGYGARAQTPRFFSARRAPVETLADRSPPSLCVYVAASVLSQYVKVHLAARPRLAEGGVGRDLERLGHPRRQRVAPAVRPQVAQLLVLRDRNLGQVVPLGRVGAGPEG